MQNINEYNSETFRKSFELTETYSLLKQRYDYVNFLKFFEHGLQSFTYRQWMAMSQVSAVPWYYINYLDTNECVYDLGCGMNFFKPYLKNVKGIDWNHSHVPFLADEIGLVNDEFYKEKNQSYQSVISINALHFHPLEELKNISIKFANLLVPGGRGFLSLNFQRMRERSKDFHVSEKNDIEEWIRNQFDNFPFKIIVLDVDLSVPDASMDGNIRMVFEG